MLKERVITALIASALLFAVLYAVPPAVARLVIVAVILVAAWEWSGFLSLDSPASRAGYVALVGLLQAGLFALVWRGLPAADVYLAALGWWLVALGWLCLYSTRPTRIPAVVPWLAGALVLVPAWLALDALYLI